MRPAVKDLLTAVTVSAVMLAPACSTTASTTRPALAPPSPIATMTNTWAPWPHCGVERWAVKTGTDPDAFRIAMIPQDSTVAALAAVPAPANPPDDARVGPQELTVYRVTATLTGYKLEADGDDHLVITDGSGHQMIAEIPDPACVTGGPLLPGIEQARHDFERSFTASPDAFKLAQVTVTITGTGFFDRIHGQRGVADNGIELHPVQSFTVDTGP